MRRFLTYLALNTFAGLLLVCGLLVADYATPTVYGGGGPAGCWDASTATIDTAHDCQEYRP